VLVKSVVSCPIADRWLNMHKLLLCDLFVLANPVPFSFRKSFLSAANVNVLAVNLEMPRLHLLVLWKRNWQPHVCDVAVREKRKGVFAWVEGNGFKFRFELFA
jgi:hypothetical protein